MVNLHAAGASEMMRAALEGLTRPDGTRPMLIAVTQLTSTDAAALKNELLIDNSMAETVMSYAKTPPPAAWTAWSALLWRRLWSRSVAARTS